MMVLVFPVFHAYKRDKLTELVANRDAHRNADLLGLARAPAINSLASRLKSSLKLALPMKAFYLKIRKEGVYKSMGYSRLYRFCEFSNKVS
jgi:hypothetical protein